MQKQQLCAICSLKTTFGCSQCKQVFYCSVDHQRQHWNVHQFNCQQNKQTDIKPNEDSQNKSPALKPQKLEQQIAQKSDKKLVINERDILTEDHDRYRQIAIRLLSQKDYQDALQPIKKAIELGQKLEDLGNREDSYEKIADILLLVKTLINLIDLEAARRTLLSAFEQVKIMTQISNKNDQIKVSSILKVMAQLFYRTGDQRQCEQAYVEYTTVIEKCYGDDSSQTGNAYFIVGIFYLQHKHYTQSLACFKRALNIRNNMNPNNENVSDCWYYMGVIYKQLNKREQAIEFLEKALKLRRQIIGQNSLQAAICLETLGKLHIQYNDYNNAFSRLQECFNIRKSLLKEPAHPEIERVSKLIATLYSKLQDQNHKPNSMLSHIQNTVLENNLSRFLDLDESVKIEKPSSPQKRLSQLKVIPVAMEPKLSQVLNIPASLLESFNIDQLIQLKMLQNDVAKLKNKQEQIQSIVDSQFMNTLSSIQYNLLREQNPSIFHQLQISKPDEEQSDGSESKPSNQSNQGKIYFR